MNNTNDIRAALALLLATLLPACTMLPAREALPPGAAADDPSAALAALGAAVQDDPRNAGLRADYLRQRDALIGAWLAAAEHALAIGDFELAAQHYREVLRLDAQHPRAQAGLDALVDARRRLARLAEAEAALARDDVALAERLARSVLAEVPAHVRARRLLRDIDERRLQLRPAVVPSGPLAKPVNLSFRDAPLRVVFEALSQAAGLNFVFDSDVRDDALVSLVVREATVDEVIRLIAATQQIERKLLNANSVLIYPATPAKQRDYQELVSRSFYLAHADVKQAEVLLRQLVKVRDVFIDEKLNLVVIKDTPAAVHLAERLIASLDVAEAEVMLELEVLEVSRSKLRELGLEFPDQVGYGLLQGGASGPLVAGNVSLRSGTGLVPFVSNPAAVLRLRLEDGDTNLLANPRIRVKNRAEARIHIGQRVPVFTTTSTANVGVSASVSYLDVGLKLDVEPSVTLDDEVAIRLALEVSSIVREVPGPEGSLAYELGTRSASTTLRLQNGETQVLAGLINDEERRTARRVPGLGELPVIGRLFSVPREASVQTEIVLLITPRIIRNVVPPVFTRDPLPAGTEASIGAEVLRIGPTAPHSLALRGTGALSPQEVATALAAFTAREAADTAPRDVAVELAAPRSAQPGAMLTLTLTLSGSGSHDGGVVEFDYDAALLEPVGFAGAAPGQGAVALPAGALPASLPIAFRVRPDASGTANIIVSSVMFDVAGQRVAVPVAGTAHVAIGE
jgi:general secretion pathway protein D